MVRPVVAQVGVGLSGRTTNFCSATAMPAAAIVSDPIGHRIAQSRRNRSRQGTARHRSRTSVSRARGSAKIGRSWVS